MWLLGPVPPSLIWNEDLFGVLNYRPFFYYFLFLFFFMVVVVVVVVVGIVLFFFHIYHPSTEGVLKHTMATRCPSLCLLLALWAAAKLFSLFSYSGLHAAPPVPTSVAITAHVQKHMLLGLCTNTGLFLGNPTNKPYWSAKNLSNPQITTYLVLLLCGDIQV